MRAPSLRAVLSLVVLAAPAAAQFAAATTTGALGPSPTESAGCYTHSGTWACAASRTAVAAPAATSEGCVWHETHWDCEDEHDHEDDESGECIIHVGHTHGDCSAEQLACGAILLEEYNLPLHVASIFIILVTSALGVMIPLVAGWKTNKGRSVTLDAASFGRGVGFWGSVFFLARHFGTGIILATAFVHLLYHGFVMFANDCVGHLVYEATAPALALAAALLTFLLDFVGSRVAHAKLDRNGAHRPHSPASPETPPSDDDQSHDKDQVAAEPVIGTEVCAHAEAVFRSEQGWQVVLLEAGIIFHSIMIGVTLGAGSGAGWTTLLIVLIFHQFFEGAALGARIALLAWISRMRAFVMGAAFMLVTPIGVAIGIGVRKSFSQNGKAALLSVGVLNSISAGILLYTAFKLLAADFVDGPLRTAPTGRVVLAMASLLTGLVAMSVLGKWA